MGTRGRKSAAEIAVMSGTGIAATRRLSAPPDLTEEQAEVWRGMVSGNPADLFNPGSAPVLAALAMRLRLTPQSRYTPHRAAAAGRRSHDGPRYQRKARLGSFCLFDAKPREFSRGDRAELTRMAEELVHILVQ